MALHPQKERDQMARKRSSYGPASAGYSLVEMLVVITIIGILSMVSVPQFLAYQRASKLKHSMQMVMNDLRLARQQAIALRTQTRLRFETNGSRYVVERLTGSDWQPIGRTTAAVGWRDLANGVTLATPSGLPTVEVGDTTFNTIVFLLDGTAQVTGDESKGTFVIRTTSALERTSYLVEVRSPGFVKAI
jgi:prepilin-type N-terminal cleavage/methylation domain-containing protein